LTGCDVHILTANFKAAGKFPADQAFARDLNGTVENSQKVACHATAGEIAKAA
jgi:hypothetical protein